MKRAIDKWTTSASIALVFAALLACKKKTDAPAPEASGAAPVSIVAAALASASAGASAAQVASAAPALAPDAGAAAALGAVKRFPDKEKPATGAVKVTIDGSKVYDEPDNTKPSVTSLSKDLFVVRQATLGADWILVEFPSGVGKLSPGWIEAKSVGEQVHPAITKAAVAAQTGGSAKPAASTAASAKPASSAALVPTATASAGAAPPTPTVAPVVKKKPSLLSPPHH